MEERIGDICEIQGEGTIEWKIKDFFSLRAAVDTCYASTDFEFLGFSWQLRLSPNGYTTNNSSGFINVYLSPQSGLCPVTLDYTFILKSTDENKDLVRSYKNVVFDKINAGKGINKFISRSELMRRNADLVPSGEITIICTLKYKAPVNLSHTADTDEKGVQTEPHFNVCMESLLKDFSKLLDSGPHHDADIKCGEYSMKAHKLILGARSEVLKAMLESDMLEGRTGVVEMKDIDAHCIQDFVKFLYTGSFSDMTFEKAKALYEAGDKYDVGSLVLRCSEYLQGNLSPKIACQCLVLADMHSNQELKNRVTTYILDEKIYLQDEVWLEFSDNYPRLSNEVYRLIRKTT